MRVKFLAQGNNESVWWNSNSQMTDYKLATLRTVPTGPSLPRIGLWNGHKSIRWVFLHFSPLQDHRNANIKDNENNCEKLLNKGFFSQEIKSYHNKTSRTSHLKCLKSKAYTFLDFLIQMAFLQFKTQAFPFFLSIEFPTGYLHLHTSKLHNAKYA